MKKTFIIGILLLSMYRVPAQTSSRNKSAGSETKATGAKEDEYAETGIALHKRRIVFSDLPQSTVCIITDKDGELVKETKVSPSDPVVDVRNLERGTYFIKLMYKDENRKGFVMNL